MITNLPAEICSIIHHQLDTDSLKNLSRTCRQAHFNSFDDLNKRKQESRSRVAEKYWFLFLQHVIHKAPLTQQNVQESLQHAVKTDTRIDYLSSLTQTQRLPNYRNAKDLLPHLPFNKQPIIRGNSPHFGDFIAIDMNQALQTHRQSTWRLLFFTHPSGLENAPLTFYCAEKFGSHTRHHEKIIVSQLYRQPLHPQNAIYEVCGMPPLLQRIDMLFEIIHLLNLQRQAKTSCSPLIQILHTFPPLKRFHQWTQLKNLPEQSQKKIKKLRELHTQHSSLSLPTATWLN